MGSINNLWGICISLGLRIQLHRISDKVPRSCLRIIKRDEVRDIYFETWSSRNFHYFFCPRLLAVSTLKNSRELMQPSRRHTCTNKWALFHVPWSHCAKCSLPDPRVSKEKGKKWVPFFTCLLQNFSCTRWRGSSTLEFAAFLKRDQPRGGM